MKRLLRLAARALGDAGGEVSTVLDRLGNYESAEAASGTRTMRMTANKETMTVAMASKTTTTDIQLGMVKSDRVAKATSSKSVGTTPKRGRDPNSGASPNSGAATKKSKNKDGAARVVPNPFKLIQPVDGFPSPTPVENTPVPENVTRASQGWTTVARRKKKSGSLATARASKTRPEALLVGLPEGQSYADALKKLKADPEMEPLVNAVSRVKRTQRGQMLFELEKKFSEKFGVPDCCPGGAGTVGQCKSPVSNRCHRAAGLGRDLWRERSL